MFIVVDNIDEVYARELENDWPPDSAPRNESWGGRTFTMRDVDGFRLMFAQIVESLTIEEIKRRHREELRKRKKL